MSSARSIRRSFCALFVLAASTIAGFGCASKPPTISTETIRIEVSPDLNEDNPLAVDLVYVFDEKLVTRLAETSARQWFQSRDQFQRDFPEGFTVRQWELVPGALLIVETVPAEAQEALASFVFADYLAPGDHRARLDRYRNPLLQLGARGFTVRQE